MATGFDALLAMMMVGLAACLLFGRDLFTSVVLFVSFGLTMSLAWVRLWAPDIALAEAAVGAGLTGALLLRAVGQMPSDKRLVPLRAIPVAVVVFLTGALCLALVTILWSLEWPRTGLSDHVRSESASRGLDQPLTAVLLVFRGYDTWLELAVLLTTLLAVLGINPASRIAASRAHAHSVPLLTAFARFLLPAAVLVAGYLTWQGTKAPGGAFQGGALLAAALALGFLAGLRLFRAFRGPPFRLLTVLALALPLLLTLPALQAGDAMFSYPNDDPGPWLLLIEIAVAVSVTFTLAALFAGAEQAHGGAESAAPPSGEGRPQGGG